MHNKKMDLVIAYEHALKCRNAVCPNKSFLEQLIKYEKRMFGKNSDIHQFLNKKGKNMHSTSNVRFIPVYVPKSKRNFEEKKENQNENQSFLIENESSPFVDIDDGDDNSDVESENSQDSDCDFDEMINLSKYN